MCSSSVFSVLYTATRATPNLPDLLQTVDIATRAGKSLGLVVVVVVVAVVVAVVGTGVG